MKKWSLNAKVYFIVGITLSAALLIGATGLNKMKEIQDRLEMITFTLNRNLQNTYILRLDYTEQVIQGKNLLIARSPEDLSRFYKALEEGDLLLKKHVEELDGQLVIAESKADLMVFKKNYEEWFSLITKSYHLMQEGRHEEAFELGINEIRNVSNITESGLDEVLKRNVQAAVDAAHAAQADYASAWNLVISIVFGAMVVAILISIVVLRALSRSISQVVSNLDDGSRQVTHAAQQIASSSEELSQASTEQAASLEETAASIEEMASMVQKNAENAKQAFELSNKSTESAEKGKSVVQDMIKAIDDISVSNEAIMGQIEESNQKISDIVHVIAEIGNKTKVINDIVFQTKLLSFNASVEAARAGEHGKGFAVVAEEVGNLAQMSGNAAKEISTMLESSIQKVESIVNETKQKVGHLVVDGKERVDTGTRVARQCGDVLEHIVHDITNVAGMSHEISLACEEQSQGVQEITRAMGQLDQVTQTNAATSEESASAAEELSSQAQSLKQTIELLVHEIYGGRDKKHHHSVSEDKHASFASQEKTTPNNVVSVSFKKPAVAMKNASGYDGLVPAEDDPRFEEV